MAGRALIDHVLDRLADAGVTDAVVNVHWFADRLESHLAARTHPAVFISDERAELLETGGGLKKARPLLGDDPVFVANIDSVWIDRGDALGDLIRLWDPERMDAALLLAKREGAIGFEGGGDFFLADDGQLTFRGEAASAPSPTWASTSPALTTPTAAPTAPSRSAPVARLRGGGAPVRLRAGRRLDARRRPAGPRRGRSAAEG